MARDKKSLLRMLKHQLLQLASGIPFVTEEMTKEEIVSAILIMSPPESSVVLSSLSSSAGPGPEAHHPVPGDPDYPVSARVARIRDSQK